MIGYYCATCSKEHRCEDDCPYSFEIENRNTISPSNREASSISIWKDLRVGESISVYLNNRLITLKRTS